MTLSFTLFDTAIGRCAIAWSGRCVVCLQLPEDNNAKTRARVLQRYSAAREAVPPRQIARALDTVAALLRGTPSDLSSIPLDMEGLPPFHRRVYEAARAIPFGAAVTYGELARRSGVPGAARAVGQALARNPFAIIVPCHRVLAAGGKTGGFSASGGAATKLRLLAIEGYKMGLAKSLEKSQRENRAPSLFDSRASADL
ncbi:methylated-DNA--[protein]-cysteine S-methyltransferase [Methylocapsa sp. D3K7]|uniref:methylated-DNA--[protein]-cysteine S-methyltransferase n=1 Tax=Methylocapsa sp. D3K7 TaxID=3041435 RepID=UPI00244E6494|nr:methylated-DNA--[protein]-cysteine S-methyltransferase [Methylocapsa sp. D3K7]WGJ15106.1 methylated-DNA--[protein]-cysteine S-methyltransferase [Methylocapsa sp. D3K7]